ncbi:hypothetical protein BDV39DRAFT_204628 [Aspergillus sergii]|uniref:Fungal-specific transcription factor domain-containing protein n=1 Tax=Aspergillus sergii TaxID=1034303 RepID=A0A5N6X6G7_9EURO|nr:hypothetical protein BDV39DRAFT_204628 [Aspergillus sergii]
MAAKLAGRGGSNAMKQDRDANAAKNQDTNAQATKSHSTSASPFLQQVKHPKSVELQSHCIAGTITIPQFPCHYGYKWLHLAVSGKISPLALQASSALSQSNFGSFHRLDDLKIKGSIQYGKVVRSLIPALSYPIKPAVEALIVPIMILLIHESLLAEQTGSLSHVRGLIQLIMVCGPERFQQEPLRSAFESCRATLITIGLISKKRCFPDEEKWHSIPWAVEPSSKSPQNYLADILVTVPGMLEDDAVLRRQYDSTARATLIDRLERQLIKLFEWRWNWEKLNQFSAWEEPVSLNPNRPAITGQNIFESILCFSAFERATEIMLYNAVQMWLVGLLRELLPWNSPAIISSAARISASRAGTLGDTNFTPLILPGTSFSLREPAIEICRAVEYQCLNVQHSRGAALFCLLPIGLAYGTLEQEPQYRDWIRSMLDLSPVMKEYVLGQNFRGFGLYYRYWRLPGITAWF